MYIYVLTSGEYSAYGLEGVVVSDTPIDWPLMNEKIIEYLNATYPDSKWYLDREEKNALLAAVGIVLADYEEVTFEPRSLFGKWLMVG